MKSLIVAAVAVFGLGGCIAVPAPYGPEAYYYPAPAVVGVYGYGYHHGHGRRHHHRHRGWR